MADDDRLLLNTLLEELRAAQRENAELRKQITNLQVELVRIPQTFGEIVNRKIVKHELDCGRIRWRNQVIIALMSGTAGGAGSFGLLRMLAALLGS